MVPTLEEYKRLLSLSTPMSQVYWPPIRSHYRKRLAELLGLKRPVVDVLTRYGSEVGGSMPFDFLLGQFGLVESLASY